MNNDEQIGNSVDLEKVQSKCFRQILGTRHSQQVMSSCQLEYEYRIYEFQIFCKPCKSPATVMRAVIIFYDMQKLIYSNVLPKVCCRDFQRSFGNLEIEQEQANTTA